MRLCWQGKRIVLLSRHNWVKRSVQQPMRSQKFFVVIHGLSRPHEREKHFFFQKASSKEDKNKTSLLARQVQSSEVGSDARCVASIFSFNSATSCATSGHINCTDLAKNRTPARATRVWSGIFCGNLRLRNFASAQVWIASAQVWSRDSCEWFREQMTYGSDHQLMNTFFNESLPRATSAHHCCMICSAIQR